MLRLVFMGTPAFARASLEALVHSPHQVVGVVTVPDKPAGRGKKLQSSEVKKYALSKGLPILQPAKLKDPDFLNALQACKADLFVVVAFRMLPRQVWAMPPLGTFNLHASLLPRYRGAAPINHALINGEKESGVTTFLLDEHIDTGKILMQEKISIADDDDAGSLHDKLMTLGAKLVVSTVNALENNDIKAVPQPEDFGNLPAAPKIFKKDCLINWQRPAGELRNFIRGLSPYPAAFTRLEKADGSDPLFLKIYKAAVLATSGLHAAAMESDGKSYLHIGCGKGALDIFELQLQGKKRMDIRSFLNGFKELSDYKIVDLPESQQ